MLERPQEGGENELPNEYSQVMSRLNTDKDLSTSALKKNIRKLNNQQKNLNHSIGNVEKAIHSNKYNTKHLNNIIKTSNPCKGQDKCKLTKEQLCVEITKNYIVRSNVVAAILTAIPDDNNLEKNICYMELKAIEDCKMCLPPDWQQLSQLSKDDRISRLLTFASKLTEKDCADIKGFYKKYTEDEKKNLKINKNKFNRLYLSLTLQMKQEYHSSLLNLLDILKILNEELIITNKDLNLIGKKTKEILDTMYSNCQFTYLNAIFALLKTDITSHSDENELDAEISKTIEESIKPQYLEQFFGEE
jgi:hypothetical protein